MRRVDVCAEEEGEEGTVSERERGEVRKGEKA